MPNEMYAPQSPPRRRIPVLKIIGTILLVMILICGGLVTYAAYNFRGWIAAAVRGPMVRMVDATDLPDAQKTGIKRDLNRIADAYAKGSISFTQLTSTFQHLEKGPFFELVQTEDMRHRYGIAHPTMDAERDQTMLLFDRFERGLAEKRFPPAQIAQVLSLVNDPDEKHKNQATSQPAVTEADVKPFIDAMRTAVEQAKIPAEHYQPDFAGEIERAVNAVLGATASTQPTTTQAEKDE